MNYHMAPPNSFHGSSGLAYSGPQPLDQSVHAPTSPQLAPTIWPIPSIPVNQSVPELSSGDKQDITESKPKKPRQQATKRGGKSRSKVDAGKPKLAKGGRSHGSHNFQALETDKLLYIIGKHLPIGGDSWQAVATQYNKWAVKNDFKERDKKSLKQKFDMVWHLVSQW